MPAPSPSTEASADAVRQALDQILSSRVFSRSKRQRDFLSYIVDAKLDGRTDDLKEFTIGVEVFDKDETFDPGTDSIVRVEASRLRSKLREYYEEIGQGDAIRIDIPKGHYVPEFSVTTMAGTGAEVKRSATAYWLTGFAVVALAASAVYIAGIPPAFEPTATSVDVPIDAPPANSLAVLPLHDWSSSPDEYFSEAMTDALIASLGEVRSLRVTSLTSVLPYAAIEATVPEIGRELGVAYVVEGSVIRSGEHLRITAQLIAADTDTHVWSRTYDRQTADMLAVQSEVAGEIAGQISAELGSSPRARSEQLNPAAYEAYMKGRYFHNQFTADGFRRSMQHFQTAIDIEPDFAEAYAGLASCHCLLAGHGLEMVSPILAIPESRALASKALELDPGLAEPIAFLGIIDFKFGWDLAAAEAKLTRAIDLNPSLFQAHIWHSQVLEAKGRHDEAVERARAAKRLNPLSLAAGLNLGWQLYQAENYIEASAEIDKLIEFDDSFWGGHWAKGHIYNQHEMSEHAIAEFERAVELEGGHSLPLSALGYALAIAGRPEEARQIIAELESLSKNVYVSPFHVATVYAGLNQPDRMFESLDRAVEVKARSLAWLHVTREMTPYRDDSRFKDLLRRIGVRSVAE